MLYAVARGKKTGIFDNWDECKDATNGYHDAKFKKVKTFEEGQEYIEKNKPEVKEIKDMFAKEPVETIMSKPSKIRSFSIEMNCDTEEAKQFFKELRTHICLKTEDYIENKYKLDGRINIDITKIV